MRLVVLLGPEAAARGSSHLSAGDVVIDPLGFGAATAEQSGSDDAVAEESRLASDVRSAVMAYRGPGASAVHACVNDVFVYFLLPLQETLAAISKHIELASPSEVVLL